ncbi:myrosinase 1-like [Copidosoma floridanum]|uniref:myrosinase 1-like n=1 Tax=Copidosoma floridanum TaxID=29053 RepID=UPI000C6FA6D2|nr:myrosinase 1-like [Copidosoma floridanum]
MDLDSDNPCTWYKQPWKVILARETSAEEVVSKLEKTAIVTLAAVPWEKTLNDILFSNDDSPVVYKEPVSPIHHLLQAKGTVELPKSDCGQPIRWCTVNKQELIKCNWTAAAARSLGIQPDISCMMALSPFECFDWIANNDTDIMAVDSNYGLLARNLVSVFAEVDLSFPDGFLIGCSTSAYQIEGAWNISDKGENAWDRFTHSKPWKIVDNSSGDVACDSYHKYKEDVEALKKLGMDFYRFSLSWTRILPTGHSNVVSEDGIEYYNNLINELLKHNITPFVTIYHWDHPQKFQDMGGWSNEAMVNWFGDYARVVFRAFGDRVKIFSTINEPHDVCRQDILHKGSFSLALGATNNKNVYSTETEYLCTHNIIKAHARAYHIYNEEFRSKQNGHIGIVLNTFYFYPVHKSDSISDEVAFQFAFDRYAHPIYSRDGDYPPLVKQRVAENSKFEGLERSRLPTFSKKWIKYIKGTFDFLGVNHYTSRLVEPAPRINYTIYPNDDGIIYSKDPAWPNTPSSWLQVVPEGLEDTLIKIKNKYGNVAVYVTENGISDNGILEDYQRIEYHYLYMASMFKAIKNHGCNVKGYSVWSLLDNFEWKVGYTERFGLFQVNFTDLNRTRIAKKSVDWFKDVLKNKRVMPPPTLTIFDKIPVRAQKIGS